jgi:hypothetical protein
MVRDWRALSSVSSIAACSYAPVFWEQSDTFDWNTEYLADIAPGRRSAALRFALISEMIHTVDRLLKQRREFRQVRF